MIHVPLPPEPDSFDARVRQEGLAHFREQGQELAQPPPGRALFAMKRTMANGGERSCEYWQLAKDDLCEAYRNRCVYHKGTRIIFNIPQLNSAATQQYVVNTITGAWCRFTGMDAATWSTFNGNLYFGSRTTGTVFRADTGFSDNGAAIPWNLQTAYTYPGGRGLLKRFTMVRPIFASNGVPAPQVGIGVDFDPVVPVADIVSNG